MEITQKKEQFNVAYISALAAQVGINTSKPTVDDDSVDMILIGKGFQGRVRNPQIDLQLKCTSQDLIQGDTLSYPLSKKNYDDLRGDNLLSPRYLVVLIVPDTHNDWIEQKENHMIMRHLCYWTSIKDMPESDNSTSVTIGIPLVQRFNSDVLLKLMECGSQGIAP